VQQPDRDRVSQPGHDEGEVDDEHDAHGQPSSSQSYGSSGLESLQPAALIFQPLAVSSMKIVSPLSFTWAPVTQTLTSLTWRAGFRPAAPIAWSQGFFSSLSRLERVFVESSLQAAAPSFA
jgi:hypothetical protein